MRLVERAEEVCGSEVVVGDVGVDVAEVPAEPDACGLVADGVRTVDDRSYPFEVVDVDPAVLGVFAEVVRCGGVGAGGQRVDHHDIVIVAHERVDDVGADESGAAGDDDAHQWTSTCSSGRRSVKRAPPLTLLTLMSPW